MNTKLNTFSSFRTFIPILLISALFSLAAAHASADQREDQGFYIGGAYGLVSVNDSDFDDDDDAPQAFVGLQITPWIGIEASYLDFGSVGGDLLRSSTDAYGLALTGRLPLSSSFALYGKAGQYWWESDIEAGAFRDSFSDRDMAYGVGLLFEVNESIDFRIAYDRMDIDIDSGDLGPLINGDFSSEVDVLSAGLQFEF